MLVLVLAVAGLSASPAHKWRVATEHHNTLQTLKAETFKHHSDLNQAGHCCK